MKNKRSLVCVLSMLSVLLLIERSWDALAINWLGLKVLAVLNVDRSSIELTIDEVMPPVPSSDLSGRELALLAPVGSFLDDADRAIIYLQRAVQFTDARSGWWLQLADLYFQKGRVEDFWESLNHLEDVNRVVLNHCNDALDYSKDIQEANKWCPLIQRFNGVTTQEQCMLGKYYLVTEQFKSAEALFDELVEKTDVDAYCLHLYANYLFEQEEYRTALVLYERAISQNPTALYVRSLARVQAKMGLNELTIATYNKAYGLNPRGMECAATLFGLGSIYYYRYEDYQKASEIFEQAIKCYPDFYPEVYYLLGECRKKLGRTEDAIKAFDVAVERLQGSTDLIWYRHNYAAYLLELGLAEKAHQVYCGILEDAPDDPIAREIDKCE